MVVQRPDGSKLSDDEWERRQYELVKETLEETWDSPDYPVERETILDRFGQEPVALDPKIRLERYLETLPEREYESDEDVFGTLDRSWRKAEEVR